jgi:hypothetical protein
MTKHFDRAPRRKVRGSGQNARDGRARAGGRVPRAREGDRDLEGLAAAARFDAITAVNLAWCQQLTDAGPARLEKLTNLRYLNLWNCTRVTETGVVAFKIAVPECHIER